MSRVGLETKTITFSLVILFLVSKHMSMAPESNRKQNDSQLCFLLYLSISSAILSHSTWPYSSSWFGFRSSLCQFCKFEFLISMSKLTAQADSAYQEAFISKLACNRFEKRAVFFEDLLHFVDLFGNSLHAFESVYET